MDPTQLILQQILQQNPNLQQNPATREMIQAIQNGDSVKGQELADNVCRSYGMTREQMLQQAQQSFFNRR